MLNTKPFIGFFFFLCILQSCHLNQKNEENGIAESNPDYTDSIEQSIGLSKLDKKQKEIEKFFTNKYQRKLFNGNILFAENGEVITQTNYGYAHIRKREKLNSDHSFQLASASKPFTAIAILQLVEKGEISLNDSVRKFFPDFPYSGIDIHQLLSHRSGMSQYTHFCDQPDSIWPNKDSTITNENVIKIMSDITPLLNYPPDHRYYYCNTNYILLASIVEKTTKMTFREYLKEHIFKPIGMNNTILYDRTNYNELIKPTQGYEGRIPWEDVYLNGCVGDKGIYSTTMDLLKFDRALKMRLLLNDSLTKLAFSGKSKIFKGNQNYGYGFRLMEHQQYGKVIYHTGWWKGFRSYFIRIPKNDQTIIVLNNIKRGRFLGITELVELIN